jgi:alanyl-tRNA synthetase
MTANQIRQTFFDFFTERAHKLVPSDLMVLKNDPTLMFTNAGMNQFKDLFLGNQEIEDARIVNTQKCLRVSGKHNDLEEVGVDTYHHTMFEMLGNWSFGDYFKNEAIEWAWLLLTEVYKIPKEQLYVTIFEGDPSERLEADHEAKNIWLKFVSEDRIVNGNKKDNFWEMGETGPCGPCSEIHVDIRPEAERNAVDGKTLVNKDHPQVIEVWNLVFMQFNRMSDGKLVPLKNKHIDTGMGLERLCMVLQKKSSNYDTDLFTPYLAKLQAISGLKYTQSDSKKDVAFRVISDHVRAVSFAIADGQLPSNTGAGYVIRRILRRAIRYGFSFLEIKHPFIYTLVSVMEQHMGATFNELTRQKELIEKVIKEEEEAFLRTLDKGINRLQEIIETTKAKEIDGTLVFELFDTYGFPADLTSLILQENGKHFNQESFNKALQAQKERSRNATQTSAGDWTIISDEKEGLTEFCGYDNLVQSVELLRFREVKQKSKTLYQLVFDKTPFYPEGGGQVGDTGYVEDENGNRLYITDTKKENTLIVHFAEKNPSFLSGKLKAYVNAEKRKKTAANHTATHLLHESLRKHLGTHVEQKGSLVSPEYLRFDFSHFEKPEKEILEAIELEVNQKVIENIALNEYRYIPMQEAIDKGAMALFGEKYGDEVRLIEFGSSRELCGGTHVSATGSVGLFKIISESSVAAGVRRIEAVTGIEAINFSNQKIEVINEIGQMLKSSKDLIKSVNGLIEQNSGLQKELEQFKKEQAASLKKELLQQINQLGNTKAIICELSVEPNTAKDIVFQLKDQLDDTIIVVGSVFKDKPMLTIGIGKQLLSEGKLQAGALIKEAAKIMEGGGGGQPFFAQAGGKNPNKIKDALAFIEAKIKG